MNLRSIMSLFKRGRTPYQPRDPNQAFETYEARVPSPQNCIDALPGWVCSFPAEFGLVAGKIPLFCDQRIDWLMGRFGAIEGANVLELGPLEAAHTAMLCGAGANVTAVEANKQAFLKCLVTKELFDLARAKFLLGDCVQYLEQCEIRYDLVVACGVLYHMPDPIRFLSAAAERTDCLYLWTCFIDEDVLEPKSELAKGFDMLRERNNFKGVSAVLYKLSYNGVQRNADFCGGIFDTPRWMNRKTILDILGVLGFSSIEIEHEERPLPHQPCFSILARRQRNIEI